MKTDWTRIDAIIQQALVEDIGHGDVTSNCTIAVNARHRGRLLAKADGVLAGLAVARRTFAMVDEEIAFDPLAADGDPVETGTVLAIVAGSARSLLTAERTALNFLQRMSGISTLTRRYVDAVAGTQAVILDTRKTAPGLRILDKLAVKMGGGENHRIGLYDMVLIKDNHIVASGGITQAVNQVRRLDERRRLIEVEVTNQDELAEALALDVDRIMLDNMSLVEMHEAVETAAGKVPLEASGNVSLETVAAIAATGVDYISVGKLTHSVSALDISLDLD